MYRSYHHRHRKPDILLILVAAVGIATAVTLTFHMQAVTDKAPEISVLHY
ncbi:MAG: hypothetical protein ABW162_15535 [Candidatus Sedimenticola sp. PURPLELP]